MIYIARNMEELRFFHEHIAPTRWGTPDMKPEIVFPVALGLKKDGNVWKHTNICHVTCQGCTVLNTCNSMLRYNQKSGIELCIYLRQEKLKRIKNENLCLLPPQI